MDFIVLIIFDFELELIFNVSPTYPCPNFGEMMSPCHVVLVSCIRVRAS